MADEVDDPRSGQRVVFRRTDADVLELDLFVSRGAFDCDGVTIARPLVANPDLVRHFEQGLDRAPRPCTYCNKCLFAFVENPLGCYEERRYDSHDQMIGEILSVYAEAA